MKFRLFTVAALGAAVFAAQADSFTLRMGGGHTTGLTYVGVYDTYFATEVSKRVKEKTGHDVRFIKAWGGSVAKVDGVIEAVQKGTLDIGLSPIGFEQSRAGLLNYSAYVPFTSPDPVLQQNVSNRMLKEVPALQASMKQYNSYVLGAMTSEAYGLTTKFDWNTIAELKGKRIALAGTNAPLFIPLGSVPVTLGIGDHYQAMQNGLADGSLFYISGLEAFKLQEVAKVFNKTGFGSLSTLVAFMNLDTRAKLPKDVVAIIDQVAAESSMRVAEIDKQRDIEVETRAKAAGVKVNTLPDAERKRWAELLKDLPGKAAKELDGKGQPATEVLKTYVRFLKEAATRSRSTTRFDPTGNATVAHTRPEPSERSWLIWLTAIACLPPLGLNVLVPLDAALREGLRLTAFQGQAAIALYVLGLAIGQPLAGIGADRWGRRRTLIAGLLLALAGSAAAAVAASPALLLAGRLFTGLGLSVVLVVPRTTLRDLCSGAALQRGMAIISVAFAIMPAVAPVLGWWLLERGGGWRVALGVVPVLTAAGLLVALRQHRETRPAATRTPGWDTLGAIWHHRTPRRVAMGFAAISSVFFLLIAQAPSALRESVGLDGREIAFVLGGTYLGFLAGSLWAAQQSHRMTGLALSCRGGAVAALGVVVIVSCVWWPSSGAWVLGMLVYSTGHGVIFPAAIGVVMQALPTRAGMAAALTGMMQMTVGAAVSGGAALLPGTAMQRTAAVAAVMVCAGLLSLLAAHAAVASRNDEEAPQGARNRKKET